MTRLIVEAQGQLEAEVVPVAEGEGVLLGRAPDYASLAANGVDPGVPVRPRAVGAPSVSANHAVVWQKDGSLHVVDLASRNGTWVRLPQQFVLALPPGPELVVSLASGGIVPVGSEQPEPPRYIDHVDFGGAVAQSVRTWLEGRDAPTRVWASPREREAPTGVTSFALANGETLFIQAERTTDSSFHERMIQVSKFVSAQNRLYVAEVDTRSDGLILASPGIRRVHRRIVELAMQSLPSLILLGPSGTGKERLAQAYHRHLGRSGPLVAVNCATLSRDRMVADLFGAEAGAYTDAKRSMTGAVERADGGTLFLDELGELPLDVQPMLLRFLETGEYQRLGATGRPRFADVRVVTATNRDLRRMVREGAFREDLFFRLALEIVDVPPMVERFDDVIAYLKSRMLGDVSAFDALQPDALEVLAAYSWRGNFREVMNFVRRLPSPARAGSLDVEAVRRTLEAGSLTAISPLLPRPVERASAEGWLEWVCASAEVFTQSLDAHDAPRTWGEMGAFIEQFLKPWALAHLGGVADARGIDDVSIGQIAERVKADRGTVIKQLRRYFEVRGDGPTPERE